jgi:hypothetical protein
MTWIVILIVVVVITRNMIFLLTDVLVPRLVHVIECAVRHIEWLHVKRSHYYCIESFLI